MEVKDYYGGIEKLNDAIRGLTLGTGEIISRLVQIRTLYLAKIWPDNMPGDMWFDLKHICSRIDDDQLTDAEAVILADDLLKMNKRLQEEHDLTPQHTWV